MRGDHELNEVKAGKLPGLKAGFRFATAAESPLHPNTKAAVIAAGGEDTLIAAKAGSYHRAGYLLAHCGIVIICVGGLLDGNIPLKLLQLSGQKVVETRDIPQSKVPPESRLSPSNLSFRGNVNIPEGSSASVIFMNVADGYFVQDLPFTIALEKFHIEHYSTGQPRDFASDMMRATAPFACCSIA